MIGSLVQEPEESPGDTIIFNHVFKSYRGMGSLEAGTEGRVVASDCYP